MLVGLYMKSRRRWHVQTRFYPFAYIQGRANRLHILNAIILDVSLQPPSGVWNNFNPPLDEKYNHSTERKNRKLYTIRRTLNKLLKKKT